ncbi:MAG TPA: hypothetical protein VLI90_17790 [Tepidisphaeraceae bacterium]|nr:hypothetical protein [Tepidisphaeraceae bacterium]
MSQALPSSAGMPMREPMDLQHLHDPTYQAYQFLHVGLTVAPIFAGLDKFFHLLVNWDNYLAPVVNNILGGHGHQFMLAVGVIEIVAGIGVALWPRIFSYVVAVWLLGIIINLLLIPASNTMPHYDIALRDLGLCLAALALGRLSTVVVHARATTSTPAS